jgi:DNA-directed RNA polymerase specialized sigma54-like protein
VRCGGRARKTQLDDGARPTNRRRVCDQKPLAPEVKKNIQEFVAGEDAGQPLSDQEIAQVLRGQDLTIARRTVAKYREELGILPSHQRRLQPKKR